MNTPIGRRHFLRKQLAATLALAAPPLVLPASVLGRAGGVAPNDRIGVGCIGVGPQGRGDLNGFLGQADARVVALCDVAKSNLDAALHQVRQKEGDDRCAVDADFSALLARKEIDAVLIATPDHWHVPIALAAARAGKDIYLEKPMGLTVEDDQLLRKSVTEHGCVFQFGTQQRSSKEFRIACELVRSGAIGKLANIRVWCQASRPGGSTQPAPVPAGLDYERWLGPARFSPYTTGKCFDSTEPNAWKTWWYNYDYALGFIAGWGVHPLDIAYWGHPGMMKGPFTVEGKALFPKEGACNTGIAWDVQFAFADGVTLQYRGTPNGFSEKIPMNDFSAWQQRYGHLPDHGTAFEGSDGWIVVYRGGLRTEPAKLAEETGGQSGVKLPRSSNHVRNFLDSVRTRARTICPIEDAVQADFLCHLSDIATRMERKLTWDVERERFLDDPEANQRLDRRPARPTRPSA